MGERPNLVIFMPDQLRADAVGAFGSPVARTPNIDALADRGTRFTDAWAQHPVCSPSRISLMTGWYPHVAGHRSLDNLLKAHEPNLFAAVRAAGYHVAWVGQRGDTFAPGVTEASTDFCGFLERPRMLWMPSPHGPGSKWWGAYYHGRRDSDGVAVDFDEATVRTAERWLADGPPEPFLLFVALVFPHPPFEVEEPWWSLHDRDAMPPPVPPPDPGSRKPGFMAELRRRQGLDRLEPADWAEIAATYHGMVSRVDHHLGRVVDAVDAAGFADRTGWIFLTDHGEYLGDFGLVEKWPSGLDPCLLRNPLIVSLPGAPGGRVHEDPVELVDVTATVAEITGARLDHIHFGRSLTGIVGGEDRPVRDAAFSEGGFLVAEEPLLERSEGVYRTKGELQHEHPELVGRAAVVRTPRWTYVHRLYEHDELYDRAADPHETVNVAGTLPDVEAELRARLLDWFTATSDVLPSHKDPRNPPIPHGYR